MSRQGRAKASRLTARGQATIPKSVREAAGLYAGDMLAFEPRGDHLVVRKVAQDAGEELGDASEALGEWMSPEDEDAWREL